MLCVSHLLLIASRRLTSYYCSVLIVYLVCTLHFSFPVYLNRIANVTHPQVTGTPSEFAKFIKDAVELLRKHVRESEVRTRRSDSEILHDCSSCHRQHRYASFHIIYEYSI